MTDALDALYLAAGRQALERFPISVDSVELFCVSENITLRVCDADGQIYALRLHRPGYNSLPELEAERCWTRSLADAGIVVQEGFLSDTGAAFVPVTIPTLGEERQAGLTSWLPGTPLSLAIDGERDHETMARAFRDIGCLAGRMHVQASTWKPPRRFSRPRLGVHGLLGDAPRWGRFWEHADLTVDAQGQLHSARLALIERLRTYGENADNFGLIHADLHPGNIVVHDQALSVIDFDDAAFGWFGYDLATALAEVWESESYPALRAALLAGYGEHRRLAAVDEQMLDTFIVLRGMATIGWYGQRPEHDGSDEVASLCRWVLDACRSFINP